jgi:hypothetical protein
VTRRATTRAEEGGGSTIGGTRPVELGLATEVLTGTGGWLGLGRQGVRPWPRRGGGVFPTRREARGPYRRPAPLPHAAQTAPAGTASQVRRAVGAIPMPSGRGASGRAASGRCALGKGRLGAQASVWRGRRGATRRRLACDRAHGPCFECAKLPKVEYKCTK